MTGIDVAPGTAADLAAIADLLRAARLPVDGLAQAQATVVARRAGRVVGSAALELYADGALLRSVAVEAGTRGSGIGRALVEAALDRAARLGAPAVFLLTTTADAWFPRFGFEPIAREAVPATVRASVEFTSACPASAIVMRRRL